MSPRVFRQLAPGEKFGRWTVICFAHSDNGNRHYLCRCACGTERTVRYWSLVHGHSGSCGCISAEHREAWGNKYAGKSRGLPKGHVKAMEARLAEATALLEHQRAAIREFLDAWLDKTDHPNGESSSYSMDAAERLERAVAELKRIAEADDA